MAKGLIPANACGHIDFDLLISDKVRHYRGCWGEVLEINFSDSVVAVFIDEEKRGCVKLYKTEGFGIYEKTEETPITEENLEKVMKDAINKAKEGV